MTGSNPSPGTISQARGIGKFGTAGRLKSGCFCEFKSRRAYHRGFTLGVSWLPNPASRVRFSDPLPKFAGEANRPGGGLQTRPWWVRLPPPAPWRAPLRGRRLVPKTRDAFGHAVRLRRPPPLFLLTFGFDREHNTVSRNMRSQFQFGQEPMRQGHIVNTTARPKDP